MRTTTWVQMVSGRRVDLVSPQLAASTVGDIAWSLARLPRFLGHVATRPYSVAQHCCLVAEIAGRSGPQWVLPALLHDAHEALIGDIATPVAAALGPDAALRLDHLKERIDWAICRALEPSLDPQDLRRVIVRAADWMAFQIEWRDLMSGDPPPHGSGGPDLSAYPAIGVWSEVQARKTWLAQVEALTGKGGAG